MSFGLFNWCSATPAELNECKFFVATPYLSVCSCCSNGGKSCSFVIARNWPMQLATAADEKITVLLAAASDTDLWVSSSLGQLLTISLAELVTAADNHEPELRLREVKQLATNSPVRSLAVCSIGLAVAFADGSGRLLSSNAAPEPIDIRPADSNLCVKQVACGLDHCVILTSVYSVFTFGVGTRGQLGHAELADHQLPRPVEALEPVCIVAVAAAGWHTAFLSDSADLYTCGWNNFGQLGQPIDTALSSLPQPVETLIGCQLTGKGEEEEGLILKEQQVASVACGVRHTLAATAAGTLLLFGDCELLIRKQEQHLQSSKALLNFQRITDFAYRCTDLGDAFNFEIFCGELSVFVR